MRRLQPQDMVPRMLTAHELQILATSLGVAGRAVLFSLPVAIAFAWALSRPKFPGKWAVDALAHSLDLAKCRVDEALAAEAGVHAHDEDQVELIHDVVQARLVGVRVERHTGALAERADLLEHAVQVRAGLGVHGDDVGAGRRELLHVTLGLHDHEVAIERLGGDLAQRLHHRRTEGDVGNEAPVHHVEVNPLGACAVHFAHLVSESCEVRSENGRSDAERLRRAWHASRIHAGWLVSTTLALVVVGSLVEEA